MQYASTDELLEAYRNFLSNLELIDSRNEAEVAACGSGRHGITKFADMSEEQFKVTYLGYKESKAVAPGTVIQRRLWSSLRTAPSNVILTTNKNIHRQLTIQYLSASLYPTICAQWLAAAD
jgi:hypothetical protein